LESWSWRDFFIDSKFLTGRWRLGSKGIGGS
jgi:hypothetical protein